MPLSVSEMNKIESPMNPNSDEDCAELEYHALMGVQGGDEPHLHARSFERTVSAPISRVRKVMVRHKAESAVI